ncbi:hypothetical protein C2E20_7774 [Micractinium conductrix]|uniref:Uncharacterized protein n=1 Tax=Micractinium conductrix TaxID=554055 RepID=A0A2P6V3D2_9CHLO|nr:hypothetical protein C2E20_7774 [Micractinium conductrix]|eukprot:PSC68601.1 hypothetical protein C2E20_7774 [Micractinium conductrix]
MAGHPADEGMPPWGVKAALAAGTNGPAAPAHPEPANGPAGRPAPATPRPARGTGGLSKWLFSVLNAVTGVLPMPRVKPARIQAPAAPRAEAPAVLLVLLPGAMLGPKDYDALLAALQARSDGDADLYLAVPAPNWIYLFCLGFAAPEAWTAYGDRLIAAAVIDGTTCVAALDVGGTPRPVLHVLGCGRAASPAARRLGGRTCRGAGTPDRSQALCAAAPLCRDPWHEPRPVLQRLHTHLDSFIYSQPTVAWEETAAGGKEWTVHAHVFLHWEYYQPGFENMRKPMSPVYWLKLKKGAVVARAMGLDAGSEGVVSGEELNRHTYAEALEAAPRLLRDSFAARGKRLTFAPDTDVTQVIRTPLDWMQAAPTLEPGEDGTSLALTTPCVSTPCIPLPAYDRGLGRFMGNHYVKAFSPAWMHEWVMIEGLRY